MSCSICNQTPVVQLQWVHRSQCNGFDAHKRVMVIGRDVYHHGTSTPTTWQFARHWPWVEWVFPLSHEGEIPPPPPLQVKPIRNPHQLLKANLHELCDAMEHTVGLDSIVATVINTWITEAYDQLFPLLNEHGIPDES